MPKTPDRIVIYRFSAFGDVLMTVPVIRALALRYPDLDITVLSRPQMKGIFGMLPSNVRFKGVNLKWKNLIRTFFGIMKLRPTVVCDLHFIHRTKVLDLLLTVAGVRCHRIHKNNDGRRIFYKYADVLAAAGCPVKLSPGIPLSLVPEPEVRRGVGIAPFAAHRGKVWPLERTKAVVDRISQEVPVYLFGAGAEEKAILSRWAYGNPNVTDMSCNPEGPAAELKFISGLQLMVTMDSGNMHLASLAGTRVLSIWGATHPEAGFLGWGQSLSDCIHFTSLPCRPCSRYGNRPCRHGGDYPCLTAIGVEGVCTVIRNALRNTSSPPSPGRGR